MSRRKVEDQLRKQNEKERLESNSIKIDGIIQENDLKLNGGEIEDSYFKWLEDNNLSFGGGLQHTDCTKDDEEENKPEIKIVNIVPWYSLVCLMISYFIAGISIGVWLGGDIDPLLLIIGIYQAIQITGVVYLSLRDMNK